MQIIMSTAARDDDKKITRSERDDKEWLMQLGKTVRDCHNMDFKYPFSMFQAFAIAIARFDAGINGGK